MTKFIFSFIVILITGVSCNKSSSGVNTGNSNNEMKATVSVKGGPATSFATSGNYTLYTKRVDPNGDVIIVCKGSGAQGAITIHLVNINVTGTYTIGTTGGAGAQHVIGVFDIGSPFPIEFFAVPASPPHLGTVTIDEITAYSIKGSFSMTCVGTTGTIQITNCTFKGNF